MNPRPEDREQGGESPCLALQFAEELGYESENPLTDRVIASTVAPGCDDAE